MPSFERPIAHALSAANGLIHAVPILRKPAAKYVTHLTGPRDLLLRWRVAADVADVPDGTWQERGGHSEASRYDTASWSLDVFGVDRAVLRGALGDGARRPAVAYRALGSAVVMVGTQDLWPKDHFLRPTNQEGVPTPHGDTMSVVMRTGEDPWEVAIGTAGQRGNRDFVPLPTTFLQEVVEVPAGLYRV